MRIIFEYKNKANRNELPIGLFHSYVENLLKLNIQKFKILLNSHINRITNIINKEVKHQKTCCIDIILCLKGLKKYYLTSMPAV